MRSNHNQRLTANCGGMLFTNFTFNEYSYMPYVIKIAHTLLPFLPVAWCESTQKNRVEVQGVKRGYSRSCTPGVISWNAHTGSSAGVECGAWLRPTTLPAAPLDPVLFSNTTDPVSMPASPCLKTLGGHSKVAWKMVTG